MKSTGKIIWLGLCLVLCSVFWAQAVTITATGSGPTRQAAINNALRAAVEQAMGAYIQSNTRVVEGRLDYDRIISASAGYIRHYDVLAEGQDPIDQVYKVKVRVEVDDYKLKNLIAQFRQDPRFQKAFQKATFDQRRVVVLYAKRTRTSLPYESMAVQEVINRIEDKLAGYGFRVFLPDQIARIKTRSSELAIDEETAIQIARQEDGDAVVLVDIQAGKRPTSDGFWIIYATLSLKAFDVTTGELFANVIKRSKTISRGGDYGIEEGAARAVEKIAARCADQLVAKIVNRFSTKREKFVVFIFRDVSQDIQDQLFGLFQQLGWDFRVARQYGTYMEVEVFSDQDPTSANLAFRRALRDIGVFLSQVEMKGARIVYSGE
ncbi:hypothetical protein [Thermosulfurimonas dismutans]|uniref:Flagellar assembly protein T N-terminal domain-containing protein n=1 Tax=Thermosulfurimonas dismutans TaxID=999894 RepID=A0A179D565_9BACT|nr:hypothetical protein [Thermosulfurimonas dismutans]OAQ20931.1 hypothetical protein TDIS_0857 [Thermosulfurimonas dismutans]